MYVISTTNTLDLESKRDARAFVVLEIDRETVVVAKARSQARFNILQSDTGG